MTTLLKFYADTPRGERNKRFTWRCFGPSGVRNCLLNHINKGFYIRAAFTSDYHRGTQSNNRRIDLAGYPQNLAKKIPASNEHKNVHSY